jgi:hypothetical protein
MRMMVIEVRRCRPGNKHQIAAAYDAHSRRVRHHVGLVRFGVDGDDHGLVGHRTSLSCACLDVRLAGARGLHLMRQRRWSIRSWHLVMTMPSNASTSRTARTGSASSSCPATNSFAPSPSLAISPFRRKNVNGDRHVYRTALRALEVAKTCGCPLFLTSFARSCVSKPPQTSNAPTFVMLSSSRAGSDPLDTVVQNALAPTWQVSGHRSIGHDRSGLERVPATLNHHSGVMAGLVPAIHVLTAEPRQARRGCPRHLREDALRALARA